MKVFVVISSLLAVATAAPYAVAPQVYAAVPAATIIAAAPAEITSQFHAQDGLGQYTYGYNGGLSAKTEARSLDGVTRGAYSYLDAENKLQTVSYTADAANGFRALASNLPIAPVETRVAPEPVQDTPEVAKAKIEHMAAFEEVKQRNAFADKAEEEVVVDAAPIAPVAAAIAPITTYAAAAPAIALAPATSGFAYSTSTLKHEPLAITSYAAPAPAAVEIKTPTSFSYSTYTPTAIQYAAAPALTYAAAPAYAYHHYGAPAFYTAATHQIAAPVTFAARALPVASAQALPEPVQDTPEVAQAKAEHFQAIAEAKARSQQ
ncbi:cuticle protein-like [Uranotaenia lowii]|uniref:cuticle protein-like n=1 Tax=Uranotaenia lowii TaxID=190385 RepID=UPI00247A23D9|nr:cuticle protein-like [Uranotaenia lowii]